MSKILQVKGKLILPFENSRWRGGKMLCLWPVYKAFPNKRGFEKTYESPHWRETFWLYPLWQEIHSVIASTTTCQGSFCREDIVTSPVSKFLICQTICLLILDKTLTDCLQALIMSHYLKRNQRQYTAARLHLFSFLPAFALSCYQYGVPIVFHSKFCLRFAKISGNIW